jgi:hypothetical protein
VTLLALLPPVAIWLISLVLGGVFGFPMRWWLLRLGANPLLCFGLVAYIAMFSVEIPRDSYVPAIHGNPGRIDFMLIMAWGFVAPLAYLMIALPLSLGYAFWKRAR